MVIHPKGHCHDISSLVTTNVASLLNNLADPIHFRVLCNDICWLPVQAYIERCYGTIDGLEHFGRVCLFNMDGVMCYTATYNSLLLNFSTSWQVRAECFTNFMTFAASSPTSTCSDGCREGLRQFKDELGCCVNSIYNNSFVGQYLPFAEYSLWSNCGLESESPGFCSSTVVASTMSTGIYSLITIVTLGTMFL